MVQENINAPAIRCRIRIDVLLVSEEDKYDTVKEACEIFDFTGFYL